MKALFKTICLWLLISTCVIMLGINAFAADIKVEKIIPIHSDFKNQYLVKTESGCVFLTDDLFTSNRTVHTEEATYLTEDYFTTASNGFGEFSKYGLDLSSVSTSKNNNTDIIQTCTTKSTTNSYHYILYQNGELRTAKKDKLVMENVRAIGSHLDDLWAITTDNALYVGNSHPSYPEDMEFVANNVYRYENCLIVDTKGLVSYYKPGSSEYAVSICKTSIPDADMQVWNWRYRNYACIQIAAPSTTELVTTHVIYDIESGKKISSFENAKQIAFNGGRYIIEISDNYRHANVYSLFDLIEGTKSPSQFTASYNISQVESIDLSTSLFLFFDENNILRTYLTSSEKRFDTNKFDIVGPIKSITTIKKDGYHSGTYYEAQLLLINEKGEVYLTDTSFAQLRKTTLTDKIMNVEVNGEKLELTAEIQNKNGRTFYPFRECLEALGVSVSWNSVDRIAVGSIPGITVEFPIDENKYYINGVEYPMDAVSYISSSGRTYIPIRYAAEAFGYEVKWVPGTIQDSVILEKAN